MGEKSKLFKIGIFFAIIMFCVSLGVNRVVLAATPTLKEGPKLSKTTQGYVIKGEKVTATSSSSGYIYLVPFSEATTETAAQLNQHMNTNKGIRTANIANKSVFFDTSSLGTGIYTFISVDTKGRSSNPSPKIFLEDTTPSSKFSKIESVKQGKVGTNQVTITFTIKNSEQLGIGGFEAKDFTLEVSENKKDFVVYSFADTNKFSQFITSDFWWSAGTYKISYQAQGPSTFLQFKNLKVGNMLLDTRVSDKTTSSNNVIPSSDKSTYSYIKNGSASGDALLEVTIVDKDGDPVIGLKSEDFKISLDSNMFSLSKKFVEISPDSGTYTAALKGNPDIDFSKKITVRNTVIENEQPWAKIVSPLGNKVVSWAMFDSSSAQPPGTKQDRISFYVNNKNHEGIPGLSPTKFTLKINGGKTINLSQFPFTGFKDLGRGNYEVYFNGDKDDTIYKITDFSVGNYQSEGTYILKTSKPKSPHKLFIATEY
ncbi:hypothetical protein CM49_06443 [Paenibacillus sp. P1XP2]|nr:hypothetical protein CM49_06443 [Paenibacillus sp. P1XP2]